MRLFVLGSCSTVTQAVLKKAVASQRFSGVVLGDLFPNYASVSRFHQLRQAVGWDKLEARRMVDQQDIQQSLRESTHFIYVTHDYFQMVVTKHKLLSLAIGICKKAALKQQTFLFPIEYDHFGEQNAEQTVQANIDLLRKELPQSLILRSDIVKGGELASTFKKYKGSLLFDWQVPKNALFTVSPVEPETLAEQALREGSGFKAVRGEQKVTQEMLCSIGGELQVSREDARFYGMAVAQYKGSLDK